MNQHFKYYINLILPFFMVSINLFSDTHEVKSEAEVELRYFTTPKIHLMGDQIFRRIENLKHVYSLVINFEDTYYDKNTHLFENNASLRKRTTSLFPNNIQFCLKTQGQLHSILTNRIEWADTVGSNRERNEDISIFDTNIPKMLIDKFNLDANELSPIFKTHIQKHKLTYEFLDHDDLYLNVSIEHVKLIRPNENSIFYEYDELELQLASQHQPISLQLSEERLLPIHEWLILNHSDILIQHHQSSKYSLGRKILGETK